MTGWWQDAVVYQLYVRSFADADGDGIGDFAGVTSRLDHLAALGVDALWLNPCYVSPQRDHGYDIADYFAPDPAYGTLEEFDAFIAAAHERGMRVLMDMVANHCSTEHAWFRQAVATKPGSAERARFLFRDGRGAHGELPPNNWQSVFGGPAWTRITEPDGRPGQWYLHSFDPAQPDFDWRNPEVHAYFDEVLRHWFDRGVDGFRIDVAHGMVKADGLPDWPGADDGTGGHNYAMWDQPELHDIYRRWNRIANEYEPARYFVGEIWVPETERLAAYLRDDELDQAFQFELLVQPWNADRMRSAIERALRLGPRPAWTLSNHDVHRTATRYGQQQDLGPADPTDMIAAARRTGPVDVELGLRRARAAAMIELALPGTIYLYQGEELGLPEVFDLPDEARQDPIWLRSEGRELGRDGCRVPLPWDAQAPAFGFGPASGQAPWLPQPAWFASFAASALAADPGSILRLYRELIGARRAIFDADAPWVPLDAGSPDVLAFRRGDGICVVNFGREPIAVPAAWQADAVVVSSALTTIDGRLGLPSDSAAWLVARGTAADGDRAHRGGDLASATTRMEPPAETGHNHTEER
ncbi:MAG TPA: alpha-amylase family glycosyl hydrolase [Protaetiibacter sp.]|nr:alpha-amylase family glycosyl hydrolase [Protaetiibacter sp.]